MKPIFFFKTVFMLLFCGILSANNIQVSAPTLTGENRTEGYVYITFDLSWANSWRGTEANNWDAAWVFAKYRVGNGEWKHVKLHNTGHIAGSGTPATIDIGLRDDKQPFEPTGNPGVGVFMYRSAEGFGTFSTTGNKLRWNYTAEGITAGATVEVRVFAIEMVYVREGEFNVGGGGGAFSFYSTTIATADAMKTPSGSGTLGGMSGGYPAGFDQNLSQVNIKPQFSDWPNGYTGFYCMKYEISQQQMVDFFNIISQNQVDNLWRSWFTGNNRHMITAANSPSIMFTSLPNIACNYIIGYCGTAYADWACLRPMTELEYEKSCRGPLPPVLGEFAWGSNTVVGENQITPYSLDFIGSESEGVISNYSTGELGNSNLYYTNTSGPPNYTSLGPFRVGVFAANGSNSGRVSSGASYWGIMDLTGNLHEQCVTLHNADGRKYRGTNGDGYIDPGGYHNVYDWPISDGLIVRGGSWVTANSFYTVSSRHQLLSINYFSKDAGFRGVRSTAQ